MSERFKMFWCAPDTEQAEILAGYDVNDDRKIISFQTDNLRSRYHNPEEGSDELDVKKEENRHVNKATKLL